MIKPVDLCLIVIFICKPPTCMLQRDRKTRSGQMRACETNLSDSFCEWVNEWDKNPQTLTFALWTTWPDCLKIISSTVYVRFPLSPQNAPALINDIRYRSFGQVCMCTSQIQCCFSSLNVWNLNLKLLGLYFVTFDKSHLSNYIHFVRKCKECFFDVFWCLNA